MKNVSKNRFIRICLIILSIICLLIGVLTYCYARQQLSERHRYSPATRELGAAEAARYDPERYYDGNGVAYFVSTGMPILEGTIVETGYFAGTEEYQFVDERYWYILEIDEVLQGNYEKDRIMFYIRGNNKIALPHENDKGVFFLAYAELAGDTLLSFYQDPFWLARTNLLFVLPESDKFYYIGGEGEMFIKNPPFDRLYAFHPHETYSQYDGKSVRKLKRDIRKYQDIYKENIERANRVYIRPRARRVFELRGVDYSENFLP